MLAVRVARIFDGRELVPGAGVVFVDGGRIAGARSIGYLSSVMALVSGGMAPADALATATSLAADTCGLGEYKGRIRAGHDADLIILDGDPLSDIGALLRLDTTILAGTLAAG